MQLLREHIATEEVLEETEKATKDLASYHASVDVERVDYVLVERLLAFLYSEGDFAGAQVLILCTHTVAYQVRATDQ
jgi:hypothetical protein